jgi:DNA transposition AAA+ family ATPase
MQLTNQFKKNVLAALLEVRKTYTAKYLSKTLNNCFYVDASQSKTRQLFIRNFAKMLGVDDKGKYATVKADIKYYLKMLTSPVVIVDEAGDLDYNAFLELKELWNATDNACGWYMMGADGLRNKIEKGINNKKVGYREIFSRYSDKFMKIVPEDKQERISFYKKLIGDVLSVNMREKVKMNEIVKKCLATDARGEIGGLRRAETLLILHQAPISSDQLEMSM